ncbi:hypothetical protein I5M27_02955 [Adhaeribacter sp. BT258]|uniref:Outer membrane protein/protective antigen OMA87 n=1 Tax=Adhaeribacter terrigena TaxID=2793070 RepID=A0ABS1BXT7_9BACT|nr:hypothetical protein [Adhaeribacter terrigena]MBK0401927.1 hypothetical protein [Adhaeribacter terrigena]
MPFIFRWVLFLFLPVVVLLQPMQTHAQTPTKTDSVPADTTRKGTSSDRILKGLQEYSKRKSLPARAVSKLFNFNRKKPTESGIDPELINYQFSQHDYKIVRRIDIQTLDPFGYSLTDTASVPDNFLEKSGNYLHIKTHRGRVRNKLLFRKGKQLEPQAILESERLLRQTDHILDARIRVNEKTTTADSVDIIVTTRDVFSIGGSFGYNASKTMSVIGLRDVNFLGLGHQIRNKIWLGIDDLPQSWQYQGSYLIENIYRSYISAQFNYLNDYRNDQRGFTFNRYFYTPTTKYAGGLTVNWFKNRTFTRDSTQDLRFNAKDLWLARSFKLKTYNLGYDNPGRLIVGTRISNINFTKTPTEGGYLNTTLYLASIGYSYRKYYKDKYLFGFGRTEDIPAGNLMTLTMGYEYATSRIRQYIGIRNDFGKYNLNFGYLYASGEFGTFYQEGKRAQGVINTNILYFTKLYNLNGWLLRNFVWNRMTYGLNRDPGEVLRVNNYEGLRGFSSGTLVGQNRFTLNLESNLFTPISFVGFRLAGVVFADFAWLSRTDDVSPFKDKPYQAFGVGIRFRNEYMGFNTIQLLLAYYPRIPEGDSFNNIKFYENSRRFYDFQDFYYSQPTISPYQ